MGLIDIRHRILMAQENFLPPEYQRVKYLQTVGRNSRIDTGVAGNDNTLVFDFTYMPLVQTNYAGNFGNYTDENSKCWRLIQAASTYPRNYIFNANKRRTGSSTSLTTVQASTGSIINIKMHVHMSYGQATFDSEDGFSVTATQEDDGTATTSTRNIAIGSINPTATNATFHSRFYDEFKIWKDGRLIRNYVPCYRKSDNKSGFYDTVNHTFNPSIGSEEFIIGND